MIFYDRAELPPEHLFPIAVKANVERVAKVMEMIINSQNEIVLLKTLANMAGRTTGKHIPSRLLQRNYPACTYRLITGKGNAQAVNRI